MRSEDGDENVVTFGKIHSDLYLGQYKGETCGEVYRPMGTAFWLVRHGNVTTGIKYANLIDAKRAFEHAITRQLDGDLYE